MQGLPLEEDRIKYRMLQEKLGQRLLKELSKVRIPLEPVAETVRRLFEMHGG